MMLASIVGSQKAKAINPKKFPPAPNIQLQIIWPHLDHGMEVENCCFEGSWVSYIAEQALSLKNKSISVLFGV